MIMPKGFSVSWNSMKRRISGRGRRMMDRLERYDRNAKNKGYDSHWYVESFAKGKQSTENNSIDNQNENETIFDTESDTEPFKSIKSTILNLIVILLLVFGFLLLMMFFMAIFN